MRNLYTAREQDSKIEQNMCTHGQFTAESHAEGFNAVDKFDADVTST